MVNIRPNILAQTKPILNRFLSSHWSIILPWLLLTTVIFSLPVWQYPVNGGSDILHHTWIAVDIQQTGAIPSMNPYSKSFDVLSFSPLFQIFAAQVGFFSHINITIIYLVMRLLIPALYGLGIYCFVWRLLQQRTAAILSAIMIFFLSVASFLSTYNILFDVKQANYGNIILIGIMWLLLIGSHYTQHRKRAFFYPFTVIIIALPFYHQLTTFTAYVLISNLAIVFLTIRPIRWLTATLISFVLGSILLAITVSFKDFTAYGRIFLDSIQAPSIAGQIDSSISLTNAMPTVNAIYSHIYPSTVVLLATIGVGCLALFVRRQRLLSSSALIPILWWVSLAFLGLQPLGHFSFLPERFSTMSIIPLSMLAGIGLFFLFRWILSRTTKVMITSLVVLSIVVTITPSAVTTSGPDDITWRQIRTYQAFDNFLQSKGRPKILAEPLLGTRLISLAHAELAYAVERTNLFASWARTTPFVSALLDKKGDAVSAFAKTIDTKFIAIGGIDRKRFYTDANYDQLKNPILYRQVFSMYPDSIDELTVYEVL